ncbi:MAG: hypothetical protein WKF68_02760 [Daejeonella sp.]
MIFSLGILLGCGIAVQSQTAKKPEENRLPRAITNYILSMAYPPRSAKNLPVQGSFTTIVPEGENVDGSFIIRAAYKDRGANGMASQAGEKVLILRSPVLDVAEADQAKDVSFNGDKTVATISGTDSFLKFTKVDLTSVRNIELITLRGRTPISSDSKIEIRSGAADGKLLGTFVIEGNEQQRIRAVLNEISGSTDFTLFSQMLL